MGVIQAWISSIAGLFICVAAYVFFMPMLNFLVAATTNLGAPAGNALFLAKLFMWGIILFAIVCVAYPFIYAYKEEPDQGGYR